MGLGWKTWTRERLSAAHMQGYLQDQVVQDYASRAARSATGPAAPTDGMLSWLRDERVLEAYQGGAWVQPGALGVVLNASQAADSAALTTGTPTRISGTANGSAMLYPGRLYECRMGCALVTDTANTQHEATVRAQATTIPTDASLAVSGVRYTSAGAGAGWAWNGETVGPVFSVAGIAEYNFSPFIRRITASGNTQLLRHQTAGLVYVKVLDVGSVSFRQHRQILNEDAIAVLPA